MILKRVTNGWYDYYLRMFREPNAAACDRVFERYESEVNRYGYSLKQPLVVKYSTELLRLYDYEASAGDGGVKVETKS